MLKEPRGEGKDEGAHGDGLDRDPQELRLRRKEDRLGNSPNLASSEWWAQ